VARAPNAHRAEAGPTVDGWSTSIDVGNDGTVTGTAEKGDGHIKVTERDTLDVNPCPDGAGEVPGTRHWLLAMDGVEPAGHGYSAELHFKVSEDGSLLGRSTDTADFKDFDLKDHFFGHAQAAAIAPGGKVIATNPPMLFKADASRTHIPPGTDYEHSWDGAQITNDLVTGLDSNTIVPFEKIVNFQFYLTIDHAGGKFSGEYPHDRDAHWINGGCVTVSATAPKTQLTAGEPVDVTVVPQTKVASHTPLQLTAVAGQGTVSPAQATAQPGQTLHFTYTAPNSDDNWTDDLTFKAVSRQGTGTGIVSFQHQPKPAAYQYDVSLTGGTGSYQENDTDGTQNWSYNDNFTFTSSWQGAIVPLAGSPAAPGLGANGGNLAGGESNHWDAGATASYDCTAPLVDTNAQSEDVQSIYPGAGTASGTPVMINGWTSLEADNNQQNCTKSAFWVVAGASAGGAGLTDLSFESAYRQTVTLTPAQLAQPQFTIALGSPAFSANCQNSGGYTCTHTLSWQATVTFTKTGECSVNTAGQYSCRPL
jgi:hypothetical protein